MAEALRRKSMPGAAVRAGAERLVLDAVLINNPKAVRVMASAVGVQALVAALPLLLGAAERWKHLQHRMGLQCPLAAPIRELIASEQVSEVLVIDAAGEGEGQGFNTQLLQAVEAHTGLPLLAFGGMSQPWRRFDHCFAAPSCREWWLANALNYREHAIGYLKEALTDQTLRPHRKRSFI